MGKGKKSVALFEVITAQQGERKEEQIPRPGFWKRLVARRKPKLDIFRKPEGESGSDAEAERLARIRHQARLKKAAALKVAQERAAAREAKRARAQARKADREKLKQRRAAEKARHAAARKPKRAAQNAKADARPARQGATRHRLRGIVKVSSGKLVVTLDWLTGSLAAAALALVVLFAFGAGSLVGRADGEKEAGPANVDPLAGQTEPSAAGLPAQGESTGRIRPGEPPSDAFRFEPAMNYIVVQTIGDRQAAERSQRFLASHRIQAVIVPLAGRRGERFEVVCTKGVTGLSDPRCKEFAARIREVGREYNAPPYRGGTDFSTLYLKKGTHYPSQ